MCCTGVLGDPGVMRAETPSTTGGKWSAPAAAGTVFAAIRDTLAGRPWISPVPAAT